MRRILCFVLSLVALVSFTSFALAIPDYGIAKGKPEIVEKRTLKSKHYWNTDGSITAEIYQTPIHYMKDQEWKEIDTRFENQSGSDYDLAVTKNAFHLYFSKVSNKPQKFAIDDAWISFQPENGKNVQGEVEDNEILYPGVWKNADLQYISMSEGLKENIILNSIDSPVQFSFKVNLHGLRYEKIENSILLKDKNGLVRAEIPAAYMQDAKGITSNSVETSIEERGSNVILTLIPNKAWLSAPERVYPIIIDPTVTLNYNQVAQDAFVYDNGTIVNCMGLTDYLRAGANYSKQNYTYVQFDLSGIPGDAVISSAKAQLFCTDSSELALTLGVWKIKGSWAEQWVNWTNQPALEGAAAYSTTTISANNPIRYYDFTLNPTWIRDWISGGATNLGFAIKGEAGTSTYRTFSSREVTNKDKAPKLLVTYEGGTGVESYWPYKSFGLGAAGSSMVNLFSGNLVYQHTDVMIPFRGFNLSLTRTYNSLSNKDEGFGWGWTIDANTYIRGNNAGYLIYLTQGDGSQHLFAYDAINQKYVAPEGIGLNLVYDRTANLLTFKNNAGDKWIYSGKTGKLMEKSDKFGNKVTLTYNTNNKLVKITDGVSRSITLNYDSNGRLWYIVDPKNRTAYYEYDAAGNLVKYKDFCTTEEHAITYEYSPTDPHKLIAVSDPELNKTRFKYQNTRVVCIAAADQTADIATAKRTEISDLIFDPIYNSYKVTVKDPQAVSGMRVVDYVLNYDGTVYEAQCFDPKSGLTDIQYKYDKRRVSETFDGKSVTRFTYDKSNPDGIPDLVEVISDYGDPATCFNYKTLYRYDDYHNLVTVYDPRTTATDNYVTVNYWDANGLTLLGTRDMENNTVNYEYNQYGQVTKVKQPTDTGEILETVNNYDTYGYLRSVTQPLNSTENAVIIYNYDIVGNLTSVTLPNNVTLNYEYDDCDSLKTVSNPNYPADRNNWNVYEYFKNHQLKTVKYSNQSGRNTISYEYTPVGLTKKISYPDNSYESYDYDAAGLLTGKSFSGQGSIGYSYDAKNQLITITDSNWNMMHFEYDQFQRKIKAIDLAGTTTTYEYDTLDRLIKTTEQYADKTTGFVTEYKYDKVSNLTQVKTYPIGYPNYAKITTYQYNRVNMLTDVNDPMSNGTTHYTYDKLYNLKSVDYPDGTGEIYVVDKAGRIIEISFKNTLAGVSYKYDYDLAGNVESMTKNSPTDPYCVTYEYDKLEQLKKVTQKTPQGVIQKTEEFDYDFAGNRILWKENGIQKTYTYDANNKLTSFTRTGFDLPVTATTIGYDFRGNMTSKGDTNYTYNSLGMLESVTKGGNVYKFTYDADGRRYRQEVNGEITNYHLDNNWNVLYETRGDNDNTKRVFINGLKTIGVYANNVLSYNYHDNLGSTIGVEGNTLQTYNYSPFGSDELVVDDFSYANDSPLNHGWQLIYGTGTATSIFDPTLQNQVLRVQSGNGLNYKIRRGDDGTGQLAAKETCLSVKYRANSAMDLTVRVASSTHWYGLVYHIGTNGTNYYANGDYHIFLGTNTANGAWRILERDLSKDLKDQTSDILVKVLSISITGGDYYLDDLRLNGQDISGNTRKYTDIDQDGSGLYYMRARYYDPELGRFITPDPYLGENSRPLSRNRYIYTENNPIKFVDPTGNRAQIEGIGDTCVSEHESITTKKVTGPMAVRINRQNTVRQITELAASAMILDILGVPGWIAIGMATGGELAGLDRFIQVNKEDTITYIHREQEFKTDKSDLRITEDTIMVTSESGDVVQGYTYLETFSYNTEMYRPLQAQQGYGWDNCGEQ